MKIVEDLDALKAVKKSQWRNKSQYFFRERVIDNKNLDKEFSIPNVHFNRNFAFVKMQSYTAFSFFVVVLKLIS